MALGISVHFSDAFSNALVMLGVIPDAISNALEIVEFS